LSSGSGVGLATQWSSIPRPRGAAASTGMGDRFQVGRSKPPQYFTKPARPTQAFVFSGTGNEYQPKCSDVLWLGSKGMAYSTCG